MGRVEVLVVVVGVLAFALGVFVGQRRYLPQIERLEEVQEVVTTETETSKNVYVTENGVLTNK